MFGTSHARAPSNERFDEDPLLFSKNAPSPFHKLPLEITQKILLEANYLRLSEVCRLWRVCLADETILNSFIKQNTAIQKLFRERLGSQTLSTEKDRFSFVMGRITGFGLSKNLTLPLVCWISSKLEDNDALSCFFVHLAKMEEFKEASLLIDSSEFKSAKTLDKRILIKKWLTNNESKLESIEKLELADCGLTQLPFELQLFKKLKVLNLRNNQIASIPLEIFENLPHLERINLSRNQLKILPEQWGKNLSQLKHLFLSHNQLETLPSNFGAYWPRIISLCLSHNFLVTIPETFDKEFKELEILMLSHNLIKVLGDGFTSSMSCLKTLDLHSNQLTVLPESIGKDSPITAFSCDEAVEKMPHKLKKIRKKTNC